MEMGKGQGQNITENQEIKGAFKEICESVIFQYIEFFQEKEGIWEY
jgi:hypothetical protein